MLCALCVCFCACFLLLNLFVCVGLRFIATLYGLCACGCAFVCAFECVFVCVLVCLMCLCGLLELYRVMLHGVLCVCVCVFLCVIYCAMLYGLCC